MRTGGGNLRTGLALSVVVVGMVGLSFAAVPLYRLFCQVTGYGGTTQVSEKAPEKTGERNFTVRFDANVDTRLAWDFAPLQRAVDIRVGEQALAFYQARNLTDKTLFGTATFNVTPLKAGQYFNKVECFCFTEQRLEPGEAVEMPVSFYIDPEVSEDIDMDEVTTITLSYTFFEDSEAYEDNQAASAAQQELADEAAGRKILQDGPSADTRLN